MAKAQFNPTVRALSMPPIPEVQQWATVYDGKFGPVIDLSQAVPGYPPHPDILNWLGHAAGNRNYAGYGSIEGELELRETYAEHISDYYNAALISKNIHITSGCNQAFISTVMAIAGAGDKILMSNPFYFNHESTLAMLGVESGLFETNPDTGFNPDLTDLANAIDDRVKAIVIVTPNNPTGAVYSPELLQDIFELCRDRGIWLILDETYRDFLPLEQEIPHQLFDTENWGENLVQLYSFSKSFCIPGHRLGAISASPELVGEVSKIMDNMQICAPRPPQFAVAKALPALANWRLQNRQKIAARSETLRRIFENIPEWRISAIGAYFSYVKHPFKGVPSVDVAKKLAEQRGIICIPGEFFGENQEQYLRIAFANADQDTLKLLAERLYKFSM